MHIGQRGLRPVCGRLPVVGHAGGHAAERLSAGLCVAAIGRPGDARFAQPASSALLTFTSSA